MSSLPAVRTNAGIAGRSPAMAFAAPQPKDFVANLERTEVTRVGKAMAAEPGLKFTAAKTGEYVSGTLVGSPSSRAAASP